MAREIVAPQLVAQAETVTPDGALSPLVDAVDPTEGTHTSVDVDGGPAAKGVFPPFDSSSFASQVVWLAITFAVLYLLMSKIALPRIGNILDDRQGRIDADLAAADASRQKTDAAISAYETALAEARKNAQALAEETRNSITRDLETRRKDVEADLSAKLEAADSRIQATKTEALGHVGEIAADTAQALVAQLVGPVADKDARDAVAQVSSAPQASKE